MCSSRAGGAGSFCVARNCFTGNFHMLRVQLFRESASERRLSRASVSQRYCFSFIIVSRSQSPFRSLRTALVLVNKHAGDLEFVAEALAHLHQMLRCGVSVR